MTIVSLRTARHVPSMFGAVGIVGLGAFGSFLKEQAERLIPFTRIVGWDMDETKCPNVSLQDAAACDVVILAVPISQFEATVRRVLPLMKQSGILVDVCTVKGYTVEVLQRLAQGRYWIATHPMFGPESYKKRHGDMSEFRIVLAKERFLPERIYQTAKAWLKNLRLCIVEMTADQHDRHTATTLFLTHYVGQVVATAGFDRTEIDTVSFGFLMDAVDSVRNDKELFTQVYIRNPYCLEVRQRFATAQSEVDGLLAQAIGAPLPIPCAAK